MSQNTPYLKLDLNHNIKLDSQDLENLVFKTVEGYSFFENKITPCYPMQTWGWAADFWLLEKESVAGHAAYLISVSDKESGNWLQAIIYQYPWHFKELFLTIPRGPICSYGFHQISQAQQDSLLNQFVTNLNQLIKSTQAAFVKIEPTWDGSQNIDLTTGETDHDIATLSYRIGTELQKSLQKNTNYKFNQNAKFLQPPYSRTIKIEISSNDENLDLFETIVQSFDSKTRYNARLGKKKGLQVTWDKSEKAFDEFWNIMQKTSNRQEFVPYTKSYYNKVLQNDWADLAIVKTADGIVTNAWMGSFVGGMGMYLYGGSDLKYSNLKGAEFIHAAAMIQTYKKCAKKSLETNNLDTDYIIYDMGGSNLLNGELPAWDGYSKFKKGFGGKIVEYLPHSYDLIVQPFTYAWVNFLIHTIKPILKKIK